MWRLRRAATTLTATYNDLEGVRKLFQENKGEIAGVILEPVVGNSGFIPPTQEFLQARSLGRRSLLCTWCRTTAACSQWMSQCMSSICSQELCYSPHA